MKVDRPVCTTRRIPPPPQSHPGQDSPPGVNREMVLEIAQFAVRPAMVAQSRSAGFDGLRQYGPNRRGESFGAPPRHRCRGSKRRYSGPEQAFADIDVAEARDNRLVKEGRLDRRTTPGEAGGEHRPAERVRQRFGPESRQHGVVRQLRRRRQIHEPEPPRVVETNDGPRLDVENDVIVDFGRRRPVLENPEPAGHAEMRHKDQVRIEPEQQELGAGVQAIPPSAP